jgi:type VI secretion system secreted protein VgrG
VATYTQDGRWMAISTPAGKDVLLLHTFSGSEAVSEPFTFHLGMFSTQTSIAFDSLVGKNVTVRLSLAGSKDRYLNGYLRRFAEGPRSGDLTEYFAELVPWTWFLTYQANCRVFQGKTVQAIVEEVFSQYQVKKCEFRLYGTYAEREYCVQYRETDFQFVSRLLEEEGIFYFFEHKDGEHTMVLTDSGMAYKPCPLREHIKFDTLTEGTQEVVKEWVAAEQICPGKYTLTDYNFQTPSTNLRSSLAGTSPYEIYDYPGGYGKLADGERLTKIRLEEMEAPRKTVQGAGNCMAMTAGFQFTLHDHFRADQNRAFLLTRVEHQAGDTSYRSDQGGFDYRNRFWCIPSDITFRPPRVTPEPEIRGSQTAVVVGKADEDVWIDKYGRVKVQFHWDRLGKKNESSSCWVRVAQDWAGKRWGALFLPRIGQEVLVSFLEGDPDQPIITGCVYNGEQMPPVDLEAVKTQSLIRTNTFKGGGFNEFRFDDAKGKEQIFFHAERNYDLRIKKDRFETVAGDGNYITGKDRLEEVKGDSHLTIAGDLNQKVSGTISVDSGADLETKIAMKYGLEAGQEVHIKSGMNLVIESGVSLTLKVGGNFVSLSPAGVFISGTMVMINSGGSAGSGSGASPQAPKAPKEADKSTPGQVSRVTASPDVAKPLAPQKPSSFGPAATVLRDSAVSGVPFCEVCNKK